MDDETDNRTESRSGKRLWGYFLIVVGLADPAENSHDGKHADVIKAYGLALRTRIAGTPPADFATGQAMLGEIDRILAQIADSKRSFASLLDLETRYLQAGSDITRLASARAVRERFDRVATPNALARRKSMEPPELGIPFTDEMMADTIQMLNFIHARYIMNIARETAVNRQKSALLVRIRRILSLCLLALAVMGGIALVLYFLGRGGTGYELFQVALALVSFFTLGYLGSIVSVTQRFEKVVNQNVLRSDPVFAIGSLAAGQRGIDVAMVSAGVFAILLYFLFAGGMAETLGLAGGIFPSTCPSEAATEGVSFATSVARTIGLCGQQDLLRMFIFAFAAGYAERLVPDVLSRITRAEKKEPEEDSN